MKATDIIIALRKQLENPVGRHLYGVLGSYSALSTFSRALERQDSQRTPFPMPLSVNAGSSTRFQMTSS